MKRRYQKIDSVRESQSVQKGDGVGRMKTTLGYLLWGLVFLQLIGSSYFVGRFLAQTVLK